MKFIYRILIVVIFSFGIFSYGFSKDIPGSFADLAEKLMPSVVNISTTTTITTKSNPFPFQFPPGSPFKDMFEGAPQERQTSALGSGFIIDESGIVITNNHVIKGADDIYIKVNGDKDYKASIIGADPLSDIAVLKIDTEDKFTPVNFGNSDKARIGDWVIAIGNPFGLGGTVTAGIVSARNRSIGLSRYEDYIQTDASINQGNSGGPLFNLDGDVIGINTAILGQSGSIGIGFAIPSNSAQKVIEQLIEFGETKRGWLGVRIQIVTDEISKSLKLDKPRGALVASVAKGSPSDKGGIKDGDVILEFDGKMINEMKELPLIVAETKVGKKVKVKIWRNNKEFTKEIILGRLETSDDFRAQETKPKPPRISYIEGLKLKVRLLTKEDIQQRNLSSNTTGVVIVEIDQDSPADYLEINNIIVEAQKKKIKTIGDLENQVKIAQRKTEKNILIAIINNNNQKRYIGVQLD